MATIDSFFENIVNMRYGKDFKTKLIEISKDLKIDPNWLLAVMYKESRIRHDIINKIGAGGLIQFMPDTAKGLGTSVSALVNMKPEEQLNYVHKYYLPFKGKINRYCDLYLATFFPAAIGKPDNFVIETKKLSAKTIALANPGIDLNKDLKITIAEFNEYCLKDFSHSLVEKLRTYYSILALPLFLISISIISAVLILNKLGLWVKYYQ